MDLRGLGPKMIVNIFDVVERNFSKILSIQFESSLVDRAKEVVSQFESSLAD